MAGLCSKVEPPILDFPYPYISKLLPLNILDDKSVHCWDLFESIQKQTSRIRQKETDRTG